MSEPEDVLQSLLSVKWRGVEFPISRTRMSLAHDLVEHKYVGVDGARVEDTGLAPIRFSFSAPLISGLTPGRSERWDNLYPDQFRALVGAFVKKSIGVLQHPEFGEFTCKAERMEIDWESTKRGGADVELSFVETTVASDITFLTGDSPANDINIAAGLLDAPTLKADLKTLLEAAGLDLPPYLETAAFSFSEAMNKVKAIVDYPGLMSRRASGQIDAIVYQANRVTASVDSARTARTWPVTNDCEKIKAAAFDLKEKLLAGTRSVLFFTVPMDTTLAGVARQIPEAKVGDLIKLNPSLMLNPEITKGTRVRYYAPQGKT